MAHLARIAHTAHPTGSPEHTRVREYLMRQFRELGHDPVVQTDTSYSARAATAATVRNILVRIRGTGTGPAVLVTALGPWLGVTAGAVAALVVLVPLIELLWLAGNLPWAWAAIAVLIGLAVLVLLPAIELVSARWYLIPAISAVAGVAFLVVADQHAAPTVKRPAPATLVYLLDNEDGTAHWGTDPRRTDADPGVQWVSEHVGEFGAATLVPGLGLRSPWYRLAPALRVEAEPPEVVLVQSGPDVAGVSVRSRIGAEMTLFQSVSEEIRLVAVDGHRLPGGYYPLEHWGLPSEAAGRRLDFEVPDGRDVLRFLVVEHLLRPEELLGAAHFAMPAELAPNTRRSSHRAVIRTPVAVDLRSGQVRMGD